MKITPLGAAGGEVTGSCYLVETSRARILIDCGLFQGSREAHGLNVCPPDVEKLDAVLLTHGHLDHTGRLPLLAQAGFRGAIHATPATIEMTELIVRDSAKIQQQDNERRNRRRMRAGEEPQPPLYTGEDAERVLALLRPVPYQQPVEIAPGIRACWAEAGHMLGSASIQLIVEDGREKRIVFSGDLGPKSAPILREYEPFHTADLVFLESTYGDRDHRPFTETVEEFARIIGEAVRDRGKILIPTFAVGRAQMLALLLGWLFRTRAVPRCPVFLDSPMAASAAKIYERHPELYDDEVRQLAKGGSLQEDLRALKVSATAQDSQRINDVPGPCLVMAGAGMCNAGRILHHLKHNLWRPGTHVMIVGFQSRGSLGRLLVEGAKHVTIHGEKIAVRAKIHTLGGFSAHAGQTDLLGWADAIAKCKPRIALTHGEDGPRAALAAKLAERHGLHATLPALGETIEV